MEGVVAMIPFSISQADGRGRISFFLSPQTQLRHSQHPNLKDTLTSYSLFHRPSARSNPRATHSSRFRPTSYDSSPSSLASDPTSSSSPISSPSPQSATMVKCTKCGNDSTKYAGLVSVVVACTSPGCVGGYKKCTSCTFAKGYMIKCCSSNDCAGRGKRDCKSCNATGKMTVKEKCPKTHKAPTPPPGGRS